MKPKNKKIKVFTAFLLVLAFASFAEAKTIVVCPSGCSYSSIQSAINSANIGDTIEVQSGIYYENVNVSKKLVLRGVDTGAGNPVVDAGGNEDVITLSVDRITLDKFEIINSGKYWIYSGIKVTSNYNVIKNNTASNNAHGIYFLYSSYNTLFNNNVSNNDIGICLSYSSNNTLSNNIVNSNNAHGIYIVWGSNNNTLSNNTANSNNQDGIELYPTGNNILFNNTANSNNRYGIELWYSSSNTLSNNTANSNNNGGIELWYSNNNTLFNNNANSNNNGGIELSYSSNNIIYLNNFINNTAQVSSFSFDSFSSSNIWNSIEKITYTYKGNQYTNYLGNYWSDYTGTDANDDGIGDTAYKSIDNYPLMEPWENYFKERTVKGDFNGNGRVDIEDATYVAYMVVGKVPVNRDADFNGNGRVDIGDAAKIAYYLVGKIDSL